MRPGSFGGFAVGDRVAFRRGRNEWFLEHITVRLDDRYPPLAVVRRKPGSGQRRHALLDDLKLLPPS
jgi:hypothetical protein